MKLVKAQRTRNGVKECSRKWYVRLRIGGTQRWVPLSEDKATARLMARELAVNRFKIKLGIADQYADHRQQPLTKHVADYAADLTAKGRSAKHVATMRRMLDAVTAGLDTLDNLTLARVDAFLAGQAKAKLSARTRNSYRQAVVGFAAWLVSKGRLPSNPLTNVSKAGGQRCRVRRALSVDDLRKLLAAAPPDRALLYWTAVCTGLRRSELAALRVRHLRLDAATPHVTLEGRHTKNRQDAALPIPATLAAQLRAATAGRAPTDAVFRVPARTGDAIKADLKRAGLPDVDAAGRVFDFHSLRQCTATLLALAGVHPKVMQQMLRHSTPTLTLNTYTDAALLPLQDAAKALNLDLS